MEHLLHRPTQRPWPLHDVVATRAIENHAMKGLPPHRLMAKAGDAVFRLGRALYPHARQVWVACGGGNNGGDGLIAALAWKRHQEAAGGRVSVGWFAPSDRLPDDAHAAWTTAQAAGLRIENSPPTDTDLAVDALFGLGVDRPLAGELANISHWLQTTPTPTLCVDLPSGLDADRGRWWGAGPARPNGPRHTLSLLTLKPGLFTGHGRDAVGDLWFDDLGVAGGPSGVAPTAWLHATRRVTPDWRVPHASHKGSRGNVVVIGGQDMAHRGQGMTGAALLAARAALRHGAGRVYVGLLQGPSTPSPLTLDGACPELMFRSPKALMPTVQLAETVTVCGCGGGEAVATELPALLSQSPSLVLDADALNALAAREPAHLDVAARLAQGRTTVLTPHPLEAARLLGVSASEVQAGRLQAAQALADRWQSVVVLKGSGTVVAAPGLAPRLNPTGNGLLATAGTGDILAGMIGASLASHKRSAFEAVAGAVYRHGQLADAWPNLRDRMTDSDLLVSL